MDFYSIVDICKEFGIAHSTVIKRSSRLGFKKRFQRGGTTNRIRIFTEFEKNEIGQYNAMDLLAYKGSEFPSVIYVTQTFHIYPSKING